MKTFSTNEEFFRSVTEIIARMVHGGHTEAAEEIQLGYSCLNGLTDGWASFMESIEKVLAAHGQRLPFDQSSELKAMLNFVRKVVYR